MTTLSINTDTEGKVDDELAGDVANDANGTTTNGDMPIDTMEEQAPICGDRHHCTIHCCSHVCNSRAAAQVCPSEIQKEDHSTNGSGC